MMHKLINAVIICYSLVIGGMDKNLNYLSNVEIFAPGYKCHEEKWMEDNPTKQNFPSYPFPVVGASGNFVGGKVLVCGGALQRYEGCTGDLVRSCERNIECVVTEGDARWCTGPKTTQCYAFK